MISITCITSDRNILRKCGSNMDANNWCRGAAAEFTEMKMEAGELWNMWTNIKCQYILVNLIFKHGEKKVFAQKPWNVFKDNYTASSSNHIIDPDNAFRHIQLACKKKWIFFFYHFIIAGCTQSRFNEASFRVLDGYVS